MIKRMKNDKNRHAYLVVSVLFFLSFCLSSCHSYVNSQKPDDRQARAFLVNPSRQALANIEKVISQAMHGKAVSLDETALHNTHRLFIYQQPLREHFNNPHSNGLIVESTRPLYEFLLYKRGEQCYLKYDKTAQYYLLSPVVDCQLCQQNCP